MDGKTHELMAGEADGQLARFLAPMPRETVARAIIRRAERGARRTGRPVIELFRELLAQETGRRELELERARMVSERLLGARREIGIPDWQGGPRVSRDGRGGR